MDTSSLPQAWADRFGLARVPLFGGGPADAGVHDVLLDGGLGSFALSVCAEEPSSGRARDWAWSCNVPHHVAATDDEIVVVRWDDPNERRLPRARVEDDLASFYGAVVRDRVRSTRSVVDHMLWVFRRVRSLLSERGLPDHRCMEAFLAVIEQAMVVPTGLNDFSARPGLLRDLPVEAVGGLVRDLRTPADRALLEPQFLPDLAVRHAGSEIFQEAHFELLQTGQRDMLGYIGPATSKSVTRGGVHFTPPALARSLVEQTFAQLQDLRGWKRLTILDPACGSAAFLHEALRALERLGFEGQLTLIGYDVSEPAVAMAEFVLKHATQDWQPDGGCTFQIKRRDSLVNKLPPADVVLINPPFISWMGQTGEQRATMRDVLGPKGRGDLSMAFIARALTAVRPGGAFGTVMPASLFGLKSARQWREKLLEEFNLGLVVSLGDFRIFAYAHVQTAMLVLTRPTDSAPPPQEDVTVLVAGDDRSATGDALRVLRRGAYGGERHVQLFRLRQEHFRKSPVWRLTSPELRRAIGRFSESGTAVLVRELFDVHQGVRTGDKRAFLLPDADYQRLPDRERGWFRPAITSDSFDGGDVRATRYVFYPYRDGELSIRQLDELKRWVPRYYERHLAPFEAHLSQRSRVQGGRWWELAEPRRTWATDMSPRIVSKTFASTDSFAVDEGGRFVVVQGHAWLLKPDVLDESGTELDALAAYVAIFNSPAFVRLLGVYCSHLDGGFVELRPSYVNEVPIPNIQALANVPRDFSHLPRDERDRVVEEMYGDILIHL